MTLTPFTIAEMRDALASGRLADPLAAPATVDALLRAAVAAKASDVHLLPTATGLEVRWRLDGVVQPIGDLPSAAGTSAVARLKVLADLLTYRNDLPQEGRVRDGRYEADMRVSTFPTLHGEKAVVRIFVEPRARRRLGDLGLPEEIAAALARLIQETSGMLLVTGPAGSGKTTTLYGCLRELVAHEQGRRTLSSLEDPIEVEVPGVSQSQVNPTAGFGLAEGLRHLLRQDPEVILLSEIRDVATAEVAFQAALTGHLVLASFHAGSAAGAVSRLLDMGLEPYVLRSTLRAVISQRLLRRLCGCAPPGADESATLGLPVSGARVAGACGECARLGYRERLLVAEMLPLDETDVARAVLQRQDAAEIEARARAAGMATRFERACRAVEQGLTSAAEVRRVFGWREGYGAAAQASETSHSETGPSTQGQGT